MNLTDKLRALRKGNEVTLLSFLQKLTKDEPALHVFYEGKTDHGFYETSIRRKISDSVNLKTYVCGNKSEVYRTRERLMIRDYADSLLFMVDKDIDDLVPKNYETSDDIFVTDVYSIENYLVNNKAFEQLVSIGLKINLGDEQLEYLVNKFDEANSVFCEIMIPLMAWVLCCRRLKLKVQLKNIKITDIVEINDDLVLVNTFDKAGLVNYLHEKSKVNATVLPKAIYDAEEELNKLSSDSYVRGKFHLLFLINFYEKSKKALELANGRDIKVHFNMNEYTIVDFLAPRVQIPEKLNQFYQKACPAEFVNA